MEEQVISQDTGFIIPLWTIIGMWFFLRKTSNKVSRLVSRLEDVEEDLVDLKKDYRNIEKDVQDMKSTIGKMSVHLEYIVQGMWRIEKKLEK